MLSKRFATTVIKTDANIEHDNFTENGKHNSQIQLLVIGLGREGLQAKQNGNIWTARQL